MIFKFRTMYQGAPEIRNPDGSTASTRHDPRRTRVGRFLNQTSLNEIPQLINVLKGEMSLVGPRPELVDQLSFYSVEDRKRLLAKPGLTGLAVILGRNDLSWQRRRELDVEYVERRSLQLDIQILLRTIPILITSKGVHTRPLGSDE